jgi:WD40 repeat protein
VASGDADGRLRIWSVADGRELAAFEGNDAMVACVRWSPDATLLAVSDCDGNLDVREPWTGNVVLKTSVADQPLWSLAWSPDGRTLAGGANMNQRITLWSMPTGEVLRSWKVGSGYINGLAWSPDGERLASVAGTLKVWDPATGTRLWKLYAYARAVDWRGGWIATGGVDGLVRIWNVGESGEATEPTNEEVLTAENSRPLLTLRGHAARVRAVAWRPDGEALASSGSDGTIKVWHPVVDQTTRVLEGSQLATWSPDGKWVASRHRELVIYDSESDAPPRTIFPRGEDGKGTVAKSAAWSPDGSRLAVARKPGRVSMLAWPSAETLYTIEAHGQVRDPDHEHVTRARSLAELLRQLEGHDDTVGTVVWSPDGTRIASATWMQDVRIWDAVTGEVIHALRRHPHRSWGSDSQYSLAWSPGSERLASGGAEGALIIWDAASGEELLRRPAHIGNLQSVSWSADGRRLATWGIDGWVKVLDAGTADELARFAVPRQHGSVAWSPDGMRLAASGAGLRVWDASPGYDLTTDEEE